MSQTDTWTVGNTELRIDKPIVMGVLNVTPDSFYDGGKYWQDLDNAVNRCAEMVAEGAAIIDIGGESTRPNSQPVSASEEIRRVMPVLEKVIPRFPETLFSVDTYKSAVAREAIKTGAHIINDISAGRLDDALIPLIARSKCGYVLMHMQGTPADMQVNPHYDDVCHEVHRFFEDRLEFLNKCGLDDSRVVLDPGIGFGKRVEDNVELIARASQFLDLERPLLYGISRKSFLGTILGRDVVERLPGTVATLVILLMQGVKILRVHDVGPAVDAIRVYLSILGCVSPVHSSVQCGQRG